MNSFVIAYRSIVERGVASLLTMLSMALGVGLVVAVLSIHGVVAASFRNNANLGYNMIVGAKGGKEQLVLNTVFYLSSPVENIPYHYYMEFLRPDQRNAEFDKSLAAEASALRADTLQLAALAAGGPNVVADLALQEAMNEVDRKVAVEFNSKGKYSSFCQNAAGREVPPHQRGFAIPLCLGDYLGNFRVVGTTPQMFDDFYYLTDPSGSNQRKYTFSSGRNFVYKSQEHGFFEAVLGSHVAREMNLKVGDQISPSHGAPDGHTHQRKFTIVGVLASSGTPNDRAVFVNMEGFYLMEDHAKPLEEQEVGGGAATIVTVETNEPHPAMIDDPAPLPIEQREVTAILIRTTNAGFASGLQTAINEGQYAQAVFPIQIIYVMFDFIVRPVQQVLLLLTVMICVVSGVSILVSIYNSMSERRHEIAVMRAIGASRAHIMWIVLLEAILLAVGGGMLGFVGGHALIVALAPLVEQRTGVQMPLFSFDPSLADLLSLFNTDFNPAQASYLFRSPAELVLLPFLLVVAGIVGIWPAISAYRTDVSKSLSK